MITEETAISCLAQRRVPPRAALFGDHHIVGAHVDIDAYARQRSSAQPAPAGCGMSTIRVRVQNYCMYCKSAYSAQVCPKCNDKREITVAVGRVDSLVVPLPGKRAKRK